MSIEFLKNEEVTSLIAQGNMYQKSAQTQLRRPSANEIGQELITYVKDGDSYRKESSNTVGDNIIARNNEVIGQTATNENIYNEWLVPTATAKKNYGVEVIDSLSDSKFTSHKKQATLHAIELTPEVMNKLGVQGDKLEIKVSWSPEPMIAHVGDHITDGGYSISKNDMKDYEIVKLNDKVLENINKIRSNATSPANKKGLTI